MTRENFEGRRPEVSGELAWRWRKLGEDDVAFIGEQIDRLVAMKSERQGSPRAAVQADDAQGVDDDHSGVTNSPATAPTTAQVAGAAPGMPENIPGMAAAHASQTASTVGEECGPRAEVGGETMLKRGAVDTLAAAMVDRLSQVGAYLRKTNLSEISDDLAIVIRRHAIPALLIGAGLGYAFGRSRRRSGS